MRTFVEVFTIVGFLILVFLILRDPAGFAQIITAIGTQATGGIRVLQGRG